MPGAGNCFRQWATMGFYLCLAGQILFKHAFSKLKMSRLGPYVAPSCSLLQQSQTRGPWEGPIQPAKISKIKIFSKKLKNKIISSYSLIYNSYLKIMFISFLCGPWDLALRLMWPSSHFEFETPGLLESISSTFYARVFCTKVFSAASSSYILAKKALSYEKCALKMLMKLTSALRLSLVRSA